MTARDGIEARAVARGAAAATGANPALQSVMLNLCARHGARRILWIGPGGEPLGRALRQAGYTVWGMDPGGPRATTLAEGDPASPPARPVGTPILLGEKRAGSISPSIWNRPNPSPHWTRGSRSPPTGSGRAATSCYRPRTGAP